MSYNSDKEIIAGCRRGDRGAQKALYDLYNSQMYTLAYRITGNFEEAQDVLQEGFLQVFQNLGSFRGESRLGSWIHTIMARKALARVRNRIEFMDIEAQQETPSELFDFPIDVEYLEKAIIALPDGYRSIFTLYEIEGFKHSEIAEMLDITESTSKSQLHKAKRMLRLKLKEGVQ
jgi:RNA polymerase sigma-70 factor (ECF subfamily)